MLQGEALGEGVIAQIGSPDPRRTWAGPWRIGVRPGLALRMRDEDRMAHAEADKGSIIR